MATTRGEDTYGVGQSCINGHQIAGSVDTDPQFGQDFCTECGARTITACENCSTPLRGYYHGGFIGVPSWDLPTFCHSCGKPFPWTEQRLAAARELADILEGLKSEEREALKRDFDDLVRETPRTGVAVMRVKAVLARVGREGGALLREVVTSLATEAAKKQMGL